MKKTKELKNKLEGIQIKKIQDKFSAKQKALFSKIVLEKLNELDKLLLKEIATNARYLSNVDKIE